MMCPLPRILSLIGVVFTLVALTALPFAACGSSDDTEPETTVEEDVLDRLPEVPEPSEPAPPDTSPRGVFDDAQAMWSQEFEAAGVDYVPAELTIFRDQVDTACGTQSAGIGPFYCPADHGVYLDTTFFDALGRQAGVELGDVAQAYVVAHEVGHHVQTLVGTLQRKAEADEQDPAGKNERSVRFELQADCFAGIWKHSRYRAGNSRRTTSRKRFAQPRSSETTSSRPARPARSDRRTGPTARPRSASTG
jgi:predicted metalloprotease